MKISLWLFFLTLIHCCLCQNDNCIQTNLKRECQKCNPKYFLIDNKCVVQRELETKSSSSDTPIKDKENKCISYNKANKCITCKTDYALFQDKCVMSQCSQYENCSLCNEYICLKCLEGFYSIDYICKKSKDDIYVSIIILLISFLCILLLILIGCTINCIKTSHIKKSYISMIEKEKGREKEKSIGINSNLFCDQNININNSSNFINNSFMSSGIEVSKNHQDILKLQNNKKSKCRDCNSTKIYSFLNCGCEFCFVHYLEFMKEVPKTKNCFTHKAIFNYSYIIQSIHNLPSQDQINKIIINNQSESLLNTKPNHFENPTLCALCNKNIGSIGLNCKCNAMLCDECYNEIIMTVKYYQCPSCQTIIS